VRRAKIKTCGILRLLSLIPRVHFSTLFSYAEDHGMNAAQQDEREHIVAQIAGLLRRNSA